MALHSLETERLNPSELGSKWSPRSQRARELDHSTQALKGRMRTQQVCDDLGWNTLRDERAAGSPGD